MMSSCPCVQVINSEIGATQAIVEAGFTFDSLMLRYQVCAS